MSGNNGGTAFPVKGSHEYQDSTGMSLRDCMAIHIAVALCSHYQNILAIALNENGSREKIAKDAYGTADALLAEGSKP